MTKWYKFFKSITQHNIYSTNYYFLSSKNSLKVKTSVDCNSWENCLWILFNYQWAFRDATKKKIIRLINNHGWLFWPNLHLAIHIKFGFQWDFSQWLVLFQLVKLASSWLLATSLEIHAHEDYQISVSCIYLWNVWGNFLWASAHKGLKSLQNNKTNFVIQSFTVLHVSLVVPRVFY